MNVRQQALWILSIPGRLRWKPRVRPEELEDVDPPPAEQASRSAAAPALLRRLVITALLGTGIAFAGLSFSRQSAPLVEYDAEEVERGDVVLQVMAGGQVIPERKAEVVSQISGVVEEVLVNLGSRVEEGQQLARLDTTVPDASVKEARISQKNARVALELAKLRAEQAEKMLSKGVISEAEHEKTMGELSQAEGGVQIAEAAMSRAKADLARCTLRSPIDGVVISRSIEAGQTVSAGGAAPALFVIANDLSRMQVAASVSEADIGRIQAGQEAVFSVDAFPDETFHGTVSRVHDLPTIDQNVVTYPVMIDAENGDLALKPGMTASVSIIVAKREDVLTVPNKALRFRPPGAGEDEGEEEDGSEEEAGGAAGEGLEESGGEPDGEPGLVYILKGPASGDAAGPAEPKPVRIATGLSDGRRTEVLSGLEDGDEVVVAIEEDEEEGEGSILARLHALFTGGEDED